MSEKEEYKFLRLTEVLKETGLSKPSIYRLMRESKFPQSYKLGERAVGWRSDQLREWKESRVSA